MLWVPVGWQIPSVSALAPPSLPPPVKASVASLFPSIVTRLGSKKGYSCGKEGARSGVGGALPWKSIV